MEISAASSFWASGDRFHSKPFEHNLNLLNNNRENNNNNVFEHSGHQEQQRRVQPLKILTSEFAENLGLHSKDVDSGYLSPNNTNGYHLPGKPGLNPHDGPKFAYGFGDEFLPFGGGPPLASRSSPEMHLSNVSPPPMDYRSSFGGRYSSSSSRASRPNSQDMDVLLQQQHQPGGSYQSMTSPKLVGVLDTASPR